MKNFTVIFAGFIAYILLSLYAGTVGYMTYQVIKHSRPDSEEKSKPDFTSLSYVVTTVGGLVSALVVAKLANTRPGENPTIIQPTNANGAHPGNLSVWLAAAYLVVWLMTGFFALVVGVMLFPNVSSTLAEIGTTWLGLAVAAGYAYFGLDPKK